MEEKKMYLVRILRHDGYFTAEIIKDNESNAVDPPVVFVGINRDRPPYAIAAVHGDDGISIEMGMFTSEKEAVEAALLQRDAYKMIDKKLIVRMDGYNIHSIEKKENKEDLNG